MIRAAALLLGASLAFSPAAIARQILLRNSFAHPVERNREQAPLRARFVEPDFEALGPRDNKLTVALFDDVVLHVELTTSDVDANGTTTWIGHIEGEPDSSVVLSVKDHAMSALFSTPSRRFSIEPGENGIHEAMELDPRRFPDESAPIQPLEQPRLSSDATLGAADSAQFFDLLVVYTEDLRASLGGTAAAQTAVSNAVAATNQAYANSGVTARIRLVGTAEVAYEDDGELAIALQALRGNGDGVMDEVHGLRNRLGADAVSMVVLKGGGSCGLSYIMAGSARASFASSAFSVVKNDCATGNFSLAHELGHTFGLEHDRAAAPSGNPAYPYGFGYVDSIGQFRDVMSYSGTCAGCPRVQYFSNPDLRYLGRPLGVNNSEDNVRALNNAAPVIANWRPTARARRRAVR